jgi:hypothetical protein
VPYRLRSVSRSLAGLLLVLCLRTVSALLVAGAPLRSPHHRGNRPRARFVAASNATGGSACALSSSFGQQVPGWAVAGALARHGAGTRDPGAALPVRARPRAVRHALRGFPRRAGCLPTSPSDLLADAAPERSALPSAPPRPGDPADAGSRACPPRTTSGDHCLAPPTAPAVPWPEPSLAAREPRALGRVRGRPHPRR